MSFTFKELTTKERFIRMKIELQEEQPFWARLILNMNIQEDTKNRLPPWGGMGIDAHSNLTYKRSLLMD